MQAAVVPVPEREYEPVGHAEHDEFVPVPEREYEPAGHAEHEAVPATDHVPPSQLTQ